MGDIYLTSTDNWFGNYCVYVVNGEFSIFYSTFVKMNIVMNHFLATYIDLVQSVGFIFLLTLAVFIIRKLLLDNKKDNYIEVVKIKVDEWIIC